MVHMEWTSKLSVGVEEIDEDHKKLVDIFNKLAASVEDSQSTELVAEILNELISYTLWHFRHEERLMQTYADPEFYAHKQAHQDLIEQVSVLKTRFDEGDEHVGAELLPFLQNWLVDHILEVDIKTARFLADKMA